MINLLSFVLSLITSTGGDVCSWRQMWVKAEPFHENIIVTFHNELTATWGDGPFVCELNVDGVRFNVSILAGNGDIPDVMSVIPPAGFFPSEDEVEVKEGEEKIITLFPQLLGML